jgi:hypothetical protein
MPVPTLTWVKGYTNTGGPWVEITDKNLDFRVEAAGGDFGCGGSNTNVQSASAVTTIIVPSGETLSFNWSVTNTCETEGDNFDRSILIFNNGVNPPTILSDITSVAISPGGCIMTEYEESSVTPVTQTNVTGVDASYQITIIYDTVDNQWHTDEVGVNLLLSDMFITESTTSTTTVPPTTTPEPTTTPPPTTTTPSPSATTTTEPPGTTTASPTTSCCPCSCICELPEVPTTPSFPPAIPILTTRTEPPILLITSTPLPNNPLTDFIITTPPPTTFTTITTTVTTTTVTTLNVKCGYSCNNLGF